MTMTDAISVVPLSSKSRALIHWFASVAFLVLVTTFSIAAQSQRLPSPEKIVLLPFAVRPMSGLRTSKARQMELLIGSSKRPLR
jgi:hypothetical protein